MSRPQNAWLTTELATLREAFERDPNIHARELVKILPRHTRSSIESMWLKHGLRRLGGSGSRRRPGWQAVADLLATGPKARQDLAAALGCSKANVQQILGSMRAHWHVAGYRPSGHHCVMTPIIGLGAGQDAAYPKRQRIETRIKPIQSHGPFAIAAGLVKPVQIASVARRFEQSMEAA